MTIRILIVHEEDGQQTELANMKIDRLQPTYDEAVWADYSASISYQDGEQLNLRHRTVVDFPRKHLNIIGLIKHVLATLTPEELTLYGDLPGHMGGGQQGDVREVPRGED